MTSPMIEFTRVPRYPLSNAVPFTFQTAMTYQELLETLREKLNEIIPNLNENNDYILKLAEDVNRTVESALAGVKNLTADYDGLLSEMRTELAKQLAEVTEKTATLQEALDAANAANETFSSVVDRITNLEEQLTTNGETLDMMVSKKVDTNTLVFNVLDFGAKGDGVTDDTEAIKAAIAAIPTGPSDGAKAGTVFFPKGRYLVTSTITIPIGCRFQGTSSYVNHSDAADGSIILYRGTGVALDCFHAVALENLYLSGPGSTSPGTVGVNSIRKGAILIRNVAIVEFEKCFHMEQVWYGVYENMYLDEFRYAGEFRYCYNASVVNMRAACRLDYTRTPSNGITLSDRTMITFHGGALENYDQYGYKLVGAVSATFFGHYMETNNPPVDGGPAYSTGIDCSEMRGGSLRLFACQVYITNMRSWVYLGANAGQSFVSIGNIIKGGRAGEMSMLYRVIVPNTGGLRGVVMGDQWQALKDAEVKYISTLLPHGWFVIPPYGTNMAEQLHFGGHVNLNGAISPMAAPSGSLPPGATLNPGSHVWNTTLGKPLWWDGSKWVDGTGTAV